MEEDTTLTRRSFGKRAAVGLGLMTAPRQPTDDHQTSGDGTSDQPLGHFTKNVSEFEMNNPLVGFPVRILWPDRIRTTPEFDAYDIYVGNEATSSLRDLSNITRRIEGGNFTVYEGDFTATQVQNLLDGQYYSSHSEIGEYSLMALGAKVIGFTDGVALEGDYAFPDANRKRIRETIDNRTTNNGVPETAPEFEAIMSVLDTSYLTVAKFNIHIDDTIPQLGSLTDSIQAVGQSSAPTLGELENRTALLFEESAEKHVTDLESALADVSEVGFQRLDSPTIETNGRFATVTETRAAAKALNI